MENVLVNDNSNENGGGGGGGEHGGGESAGGGGFSHIVLSVVVTAILTALLTLAGTFVFKGGAIRALGGVAVSQISEPELYVAGTNCGDTRVVAMTNFKKSFCYLTDISVRQGNLIAEGGEEGMGKEGWDICKIEKGAGDIAEQFVLIASMKGTCGGNPPKPGLPEIACKARCVRLD
jgi:hypothetical protein